MSTYNNILNELSIYIFNNLISKNLNIIKTKLLISNIIVKKNV